MKEGIYNFKLKAKGADGNWTAPISYSFQVLPPWYRTWWAYSLYAAIIGISIYSFIRWRTNSLQKEKEHLEKKVHERTIELKESFEQLKSAQDQLIHSEKMASLGELTAGIAHEIQNPLNFVNNFSEVTTELLDDLNGEIVNGDMEEVKFILQDIKQNLEKIQHHGRRADGIVKGMLEHSRSKTGEKVPTDLNLLAVEFLRLADHGHQAKNPTFHAELVTNFDPELPKVKVIPQDIGRVLLNLINNALYAVFIQDSAKSDNNYRPTVTLSTKVVHSRPGEPANRKVQITVSDNGHGVPKEIKDKIFQPFFTTKPAGQGIGLGLSLSYDIVKAHGGELSMQSVEGESTEFCICLPL